MSDTTKHYHRELIDELREIVGSRDTLPPAPHGRTCPETWPAVIRQLCNRLEEQEAQTQSLMFALEELAAIPSLAKGAFLMWKDGKVYQVAPDKVEGIWRALLEHATNVQPAARRAMASYYAVAALAAAVAGDPDAEPADVVRRCLAVRKAAKELLEECHPLMEGEASRLMERLAKAVGAE